MTLVAALGFFAIILGVASLWVGITEASIRRTLNRIGQNTKENRKRFRRIALDGAASIFRLGPPPRK